MWSVREGSKGVSDGQHEDPGVTPCGLQVPSSMPPLEATAGIADHIGAASAAAQRPALKPALKRASSSPRRRQNQVVHFTPRSDQTPDNFPITPNTNWSTWVWPDYSSPSYQDPNQDSHSSYTISQPQIHSNSNHSGGNASGSSQQTYHQQQALMMHYPPNFNPQTPPQQTAGYYSTPSPPSTTPQQQRQPTQYPQYGQPQSAMMSGRGPPGPPPQQQYPHQPPMMMPPQQNMMHMSGNPMQAWYNSIPEPRMGPFQPPIPLMRGTQFMPGLSSMHPVEAQYMMYIATKRWQASPMAQTTFPNFAAMPLPRLSIKERNEMEGLRECFDLGRFPGDTQDQESPAKNPFVGNGYNHGQGNNNAAPPPAAGGNNNHCCGHHCCGNHAAAGPSNGNNHNNGNPQPATAPDASDSGSSSSASSSSSESDSEPEDPAVRRHKDWVDHAWFDIFGTLYPPRRRFTADQFWSRRDCRILAIMETKYEGVKWAEFSAQFCNATGRYVPPEYIQYKMEHDGEPIGSDDDEDESDDDDEFAESSSSSSASSAE
ncbi:hypothetical protein PG985_013330 [Apiospora marii]|uniref:uncharacterized protein n=1 Tax=Apiospora marii TaxID=335849 RepID=UPI00312E3425